MIRVYITSENGKGLVSSMEFESIEDVKLFTANLGRRCEITLEEVREKNE